MTGFAVFDPREHVFFVNSSVPFKSYCCILALDSLCNDRLMPHGLLDSVGVTLAKNILASLSQNRCVTNGRSHCVKT